MAKKKWTKKAASKIYYQPFLTLLYRAHSVHRKYFKTNEMELCTLANIKTGNCPEDCKYCTQSGHYKTGLFTQKLSDVESIVAHAKIAKEKGSQRFCMGAAWRSPPQKDFPRVLEMIKAVKALGLETCVTLGMLNQEQAIQLKEAGLDFYNHNLDTSPEYYSQIVSTHTYEDRLQTLERVRQANIQVCSGGILGMGESIEDRIGLLVQLENLSSPPASVTINKLIPMLGTPLANAAPIEHLDFVRTIAVARIMMPQSRIRLSAGRNSMSTETQVMCFFAGANSIFYGEKLLTSANPEAEDDLKLLKALGLSIRNQPIHDAHVDSSS